MSDIATLVAALAAVLGMMVTCIGFIFGLRSGLNQVQAELKDIKTELKSVGNLMIIQGRHDERISMMQATQVAQGKRLDETTRRLNVALDHQALNIPEDEVPR